MFGRGRRIARRTARRTTRRVIRRRTFIAAPLMLRRPVIRRPFGSLLIVGATAGIAYKLGKADAQKIQEHTGVPPDQLSEDDLKEAMQDLNIQSESLNQQDMTDIQSAQASSTKLASSGSADVDSAPNSMPKISQKTDYIQELERLAELRDRGILTPEDFEAKKKQLLGL